MASAAVDRLSKLPDGILVDILSHLSTDDMVRTSVLSSRWRRLWTASPVLHFTRAFSRVSREPKDYPAIVDHCLRLCSASPKLRSARFLLTTDTAATDRWIRFSASGGVEELTLTPVFLGRGRVDVPPSLFYCRLLSTLKLSSCLIPSVPSGFYGFPCLRTLAFTHVSIDDDTLRALLSACPRIEHLSLSSVREITSLVIRAPAMRHLMVHDCPDLDHVRIVHVPELRRLMYCGDLSFFGYFDEAVAPKLEEATMFSSAWCDFIDLQPWMDLVTFISHARILHVNSWLFEFTVIQDIAFGVQRPTFENLDELHWWPVFKKESLGPSSAEPWCAEVFSDSLYGLVLFLRGCTYLRQLCILCTYYMEEEEATDGFGYDIDDCSQSSDDDVDDPLKDLKGVRHMLPLLKTVRMTEFSGTKGEMRLLEFLEDKAVALESMTLYYVREVHPKLNKIQKQLSSFRRASPVARTSISEFDEDKVCPKHENMWYEFMVV